MTAVAVGAPVDANVLPEAAVLEQWMMGASKDSDRSACFLRGILQANPGYGQYLSKDEELSGIVQLFARRFRQTIQSAESPIQPSSLYKPICELAWRVVAMVLCSVTELTHMSKLPVPPESQGLVKMLLQTNLDLSEKLKTSRRAYLRELSEHRDKQRVHSEKTARTVAMLKEQPIMFYEPLEFVLDETTKDFIRDAVEERVKLEVGERVEQNDTNAELEHHLEDLEEEKKNSIDEMRRLKATALKNEDKAIRIEKELEVVKREAKKWQTLVEEKTAEAETVAVQLQSLKESSHRRSVQLEEEAGAKLTEGHAHSDALDEMRKQLDAQLVFTEELQHTIDKLEEEPKPQSMETGTQTIPEKPAPKKPTPEVKAVEKMVAEDSGILKALREQLEQCSQVEQELRATNQSLEQDLEDERQHVCQLSQSVELLGQEAAEAAEAKDCRSRKAGGGKGDKESKRDDKDAGSLEEKLRAEASLLKEAPDSIVEDTSLATQTVVEKPEPEHDHTFTDEDIQNAVQELSIQHQKVAKEHQATIDQQQVTIDQQQVTIDEYQASIDRLMAEVDAAQKQTQKEVDLRKQQEPDRLMAEVDAAQKQTQKEVDLRKQQDNSSSKEKEMDLGAPVADAPEAAKVVKLQKQYEDLSEQHEQLQARYEMMVAKLKAQTGTENIEEAMATIKNFVLQPAVKVKKKAFLRLYEDAQRRMSRSMDMQADAEIIQRVQEEALVEATLKITDQKSLMAVKTLCHLQKAASAMSGQFTQAFGKFESQNPDALENSSVAAGVVTDKVSHATMQFEGADRIVARSFGAAKQASHIPPQSMKSFRAAGHIVMAAGRVAPIAGASRNPRASLGQVGSAQNAATSSQSRAALSVDSQGTDQPIGLQSHSSSMQQEASSSQGLIASLRSTLPNAGPSGNLATSAQAEARVFPGVGSSLLGVGPSGNWHSVPVPQAGASPNGNRSPQLASPQHISGSLSEHSPPGHDGVIQSVSASSNGMLEVGLLGTLEYSVPTSTNSALAPLGALANPESSTGSRRDASKDSLPIDQGSVIQTNGASHASYNSMQADCSGDSQSVLPHSASPSAGGTSVPADSKVSHQFLAGSTGDVSMRLAGCGRQVLPLSHAGATASGSCGLLDRDSSTELNRNTNSSLILTDARGRVHPMLPKLDRDSVAPMLPKLDCDYVASAQAGHRVGTVHPESGDIGFHPSASSAMSPGSDVEQAAMMGLDAAGLCITAQDAQAPLQRLRQLQAQKLVALAADDLEEARKLKSDIRSLQGMLLKHEPLSSLHREPSDAFKHDDSGSSKFDCSLFGASFDLSPGSRLNLSSLNLSKGSPNSTRFTNVKPEAVFGGRLPTLDSPSSRTGLFATLPPHESNSLSPPPPAPNFSVGFQLPPSPVLKPSRSEVMSPMALGAAIRIANREPLPANPNRADLHRQLPRAGALTSMRSAPNLALTATQCQRDGPSYEPSSKRGKHQKKDRSEDCSPLDDHVT